MTTWVQIKKHGLGNLLGLVVNWESLVADDQENQKEKFFYPTGRYYGKFTPENLAFNANLQEFAQRVSLLCGLETGGKLSPEAAYDEIKQLWKQLRRSKREFLDQTPPPQPDLPDD